MDEIKLTDEEIIEIIKQAKPELQDKQIKVTDRSIDIISGLTETIQIKYNLSDKKTVIELWIRSRSEKTFDFIEGNIYYTI